MSGATASIVLANIAYALIGVGLAAIGVFDRRRSSLVDALLGIPLGIAVVLLLRPRRRDRRPDQPDRHLRTRPRGHRGRGSPPSPWPAGSQSKEHRGRGSSWS